MVLYQTADGSQPDADTAVSYAEALGWPEIPVLADPTAAVGEATAWDGEHIPGKCVLSPEMVLLHCYYDDDDTEGFEAIVEDAR